MKYEAATSPQGQRCSRLASVLWDSGDHHDFVSPQDQRCTRLASVMWGSEDAYLERDLLCVATTATVVTSSFEINDQQEKLKAPNVPHGFVINSKQEELKAPAVPSGSVSNSQQEELKQQRATGSSRMQSSSKSSGCV